MYLLIQIKMKKILLLLLLIISPFIGFSDTYAANPVQWPREPPKPKVPVTVYVTENIPWLWCQKCRGDLVTTWGADCWDVKDWKFPREKQYKCTVESWMWAIFAMAQWILNSLMVIVWLAWVLFIVYSWIMMSMSAGDSKASWDAKKNIIAAIIWVIFLFIWSYVLRFIAPWVYTL